MFYVVIFIDSFLREKPYMQLNTISPHHTSKVKQLLLRTYRTGILSPEHESLQMLKNFSKKCLDDAAKSVSSDVKTPRKKSKANKKKNQESHNEQ